MKFLIIILISTMAFAGDYYQSYSSYPSYSYKNLEPIVKINNKVKVISRQINLIPLEVPEVDKEQEAALQKQWELVTSQIPIPQRLDQTNVFRRHKFQQNVANYNAPLVEKQNVQSRLTTRIYTGYIKQSFSVNNKGVINLDLSNSEASEIENDYISY